MKISTTITAVFIMVAVLLTILGTYNFINTSTEVIEEQVQANLLSTAESRANHIETYLNQNIERLKLITSRTKLRATLTNYNKNLNEADLAIINNIIKDAKEPIEAFERICIINVDGIVITSTDSNFCKKNVADKHFFKNSLDKYTIHFVEEDDVYKIFVAGPIERDGELLGMGLTVVNINILEGIVNDRTGLGETGEVLITTQEEGQERLYLFERLFENQAISQDTESIATAEPMKQALLGNKQLFKSTLDYRDKEVIAVSQNIETGHIGLVAKIDRQEAVGSIRNKLIKDVSIIGMVIFIIAGGVGWLLGKKITKPIKKLTKDVDEITKGKLDIQLEKSNVQEIQSLTDSLNRVLASLKLAILRTGASAGELGLGALKKKAEEAEEKYKVLFDSSADAIMTLAPPTWKFTSANPAALKIFGAKDEEEFNTKGPGDVSPKNQPDGTNSAKFAKTMIEKAMKEGSAFFNWTHKKLDDGEFPATVLLTKVKVGEDEFLQATVRDVSKQQATQEKYEAVIHSIDAGILAADPKTKKYIFANKGMTKLTGYSEEELMKMDVSKLHPKKSLPQVIKAFKAQLTGKIKTAKALPIKKKDGKVIDVDISSTPEKIEGKEVLLGIFRKSEKRVCPPVESTKPTTHKSKKTIKHTSKQIRKQAKKKLKGKHQVKLM